MAEGGGRFVEYAGGYTDMVAQRGQGVQAKAPAKPQPARAGEAPDSKRPAAAKRRLSFKDKHALQDLPVRIARLEAEITALQKELADESLYARDPNRFAEAASRLSTLQSDLAAAEDRWIAVETLREDIERPR